MSYSYSDEVDAKKILLLNKNLNELPKFLKEFFGGIAINISTNTRLAYSYDLKNFFNYLIKNEPDFDFLSINSFSLNDLSKVNVDHIENFLNYITYYEKEDDKGIKHRYKNLEKAKSRKLSSIRRMFLYFNKKRKLSYNPANFVDNPKIHEKVIVRLDVKEISNLLDEVSSGSKLTERQRNYHNFTKNRDLAIITLLLGTGIRVSECVGIGISDIDFYNNSINIIRKGGNESIIYFGEEVKNALEIYYNERIEKSPNPGHEEAFFLSMQNRRITPRTIQKLVKKYASLVTKFKKISPHKLRSTYGTNLYKETQDIYLVATVLGHKNVNTTKKYYAAIDEDRKKSAINYIKLKNNEN